MLVQIKQSFFAVATFCEIINIDEHLGIGEK